MKITTNNISLHSFRPELSQLLFEIRNDESIRRGMRDSNPISWVNHTRWVQDNLIEGKAQQLFIVYWHEEPTGIALLRNFKDSAAEIGILIKDSAAHPLAAYYASHLLAYYGFKILGLNRLYSYVPRHNDRALAYNLKCGFTSTNMDTKEYHCLCLTIETSRSKDTHKHFGRRHRILITP